LQRIKRGELESSPCDARQAKRLRIRVVQQQPNLFDHSS
jgi:hypothetical protein